MGLKTKGFRTNYARLLIVIYKKSEFCSVKYSVPYYRYGITINTDKIRPSTEYGPYYGKNLIGRYSITYYRCPMKFYVFHER